MCVHMGYKIFYGTLYDGVTSEMLLLISKRRPKLNSLAKVSLAFEIRLIVLIRFHA